MTVDWAAVRSDFPALANWTYLNTATFGQLPRRATEAVRKNRALHKLSFGYFLLNRIMKTRSNSYTFSPFETQ